jgi:LysR family transcriptional regulator, glycine cleavage system transcriptional activator
MSISVVRLPSMDLIRSFVAVGRRMSITLAADDLCVTQSAVSRQIHALEEMLGVKLLVRGHRSITFTPEGERLFSVADTAVRQLQEVVGSISVARDRRPVTVSAPVGFAGLWLLPRMGHFQQRHPDIDLRISANARLVDLRNEGIDLAIRYCPPAAAPQGALRLFGETLAPVAHPSLCTRPLERPEQISEHFLLEFDDLRRFHLQWADWLSAMGWTNAKPKGILRFNQYDQVIHAALAGQGIALGRLELLKTMLAERRLVVLSRPRVAEHEYAHWLIQGDAEPREDVLDVITWVRSQAAEMKLGESTFVPMPG